MRKCSLIFLLVLVVLLPGSRPSLAHGATGPASAGLRLLRSDESGVVLNLLTPAYDLVPATLPAGPFHRLTVAGYDLTQGAGQPQVPVMNALLGVPAGAQIELRILADDAVSLPGRFNLLPAPHPVPLTNDLQPGKLVFEPDQAAYASDALYPSAPARIAGDAWLRDQRIVRVELYPFQYNPARGTLLWHRRLRVEVRFVEEGNKGKREKGNKEKGETGGRGAGRQSVPGSPFETMLRETLLNYDSTRTWRGQPTNQPANQPTNQPANQPTSQPANQPTSHPAIQPSTARYKITIDHDALYQATYVDLEAAGMDVDAVDPRTFHLTSQGQDVAIYVAGEDDGRFDPGDTVTFYGQKFRGAHLAEEYADEMTNWLTLCPKCQLAGMFEKYTDENVYWLTAGGAPGPRMDTVDGTPTDTAPVPAYYRTTVHAEQSHEWYTHHFTSEDTWFWERVQPGFDDAIRTYTTTLTAVARGSFTATVRAAVVSRSSNAGHHTQFYLNGGPQPLDDALWDGVSRHSFEAEVPQSQLWATQRLYLPLVQTDARSPAVAGGNGATADRPARQPINARAFPPPAGDADARLDFVTLYNGAVEDMYFDWFEIEYVRMFRAVANQLLFPGEAGGTWQYEIRGFDAPEVQVYDVTHPLAPIRVLNPRASPADGDYRLAFEITHGAGASFLAGAALAVQRPKAVLRYVPPDLDSSDNGADYIIITHRQFFDAVQRLADYRAAQGMRVRVVDVADLYNEFNYGIYHPIAIRNFLAYAFANWEIRPTYVLLVGDGHWNLKGYSGYDAPPIYVPPNLAFVDPWQGEVDSTNLLAAVVGDDILPDLAIGRLPVNSVAELNAAIDKIIAYEQAGPQEWQRHALFVADNVPDDAGDFVGLADDIIANHVPAGIEADRIYLNDYCGSPTNPPTPCPAVNTAIVDALNQAGALLVSYIGHASVERWAHEQVFVNADIPSLDNGGRLPVVLSMTCLDGYYYHPDLSSLAEELVRADGYGAVSTFSPTGLGVATGHHVMQRRFYDAVFRDGVRVLGPATLAAKLALYATGNNYDLIHTFTIFGDPALRLQVPAPTVYSPLISR